MIYHLHLLVLVVEPCSKARLFAQKVGQVAYQKGHANPVPTYGGRHSIETTLDVSPTISMTRYHPTISPDTLPPAARALVRVHVRVRVPTDETRFFCNVRAGPNRGILEYEHQILGGVGNQ